MSNSLKLAIGWVLTVFVALAFSWGAIGQVRNRVDQPSTVIPTINDGVVPADGAGGPSDPAVVPVVVVLPEDIDGSVPPTSALHGVDTTSTTSHDTESLDAAEAPATTSAPPTTASASDVGDTAPPTIASASGSGQTTSSTTSTTAAPATQTSSYTLTGGTVTISHSPGVVNLVGASPASGYSTEVKHAGPKEVKVVFTSGERSSKFSAEWKSGELKIDKEEKDDHDHD